MLDNINPFLAVVLGSVVLGVGMIYMPKFFGITVILIVVLMLAAGMREIGGSS